MSSALHVAAANGNAEVVQWLLQEGANINFDRSGSPVRGRESPRKTEEMSLKVLIIGDGAIGKVRLLDSAVPRWLDLVWCRRLACSIHSARRILLIGMHQNVSLPPSPDGCVTGAHGAGCR